jgi:hypothetical protein
VHTDFVCVNEGETMCVSWNPGYYLWCDGQQWRDAQCPYYDHCEQGPGNNHSHPPC